MLSIGHLTDTELPVCKVCIILHNANIHQENLPELQSGRVR